MGFSESFGMLFPIGVFSLGRKSIIFCLHLLLKFKFLSSPLGSTLFPFVELAFLTFQ